MSRIEQLTPEQEAPIRRLLQSEAGWWWPFEGVCIITEGPRLLRRDGEHRLHCADGPALQYPDGWSIHAWHGYRVPSWIIEHPERLTPAVISGELNAELRRVMLEIYGYDRWISETGARLLSDDVNLGQPRRLYEAEVAGERVRILHVVNHSLEPDGSRREFHLGMTDEIETPHDGVAMSFGFMPEHYREACAS